MGSEILSESQISRGFLTVVPAKVRRATGAHAGDRLEWRLRGSELIVRVRPRSTIGDIAGLISCGGDAVQSKKAVQGLRARVR